MLKFHFNCKMTLTFSVHSLFLARLFVELSWAERDHIELGDGRPSTPQFSLQLWYVVLASMNFVLHYDEVKCVTISAPYLLKISLKIIHSMRKCVVENNNTRWTTIEKEKVVRNKNSLLWILAVNCIVETVHKILSISIIWLKRINRKRERENSSKCGNKMFQSVTRTKQFSF